MTLLLLALALFAIISPAAALAWGLVPRRQAEPPAAPGPVAYRTTLLLGDDCCLCIGPGKERRAA